MLTISRPQSDECAPYHREYIDLVTESDVLAALAPQAETLRRVATQVPPQKETHAYAPNKWTVRQVVGHMGDAERAFGFRAFAFSRFDKNPLPGFEEDDYVANSRHDVTPLGELVEEFALLRQVNLRLLRGLTDAQWMSIGTANGHRVSVRALAYIMVGHARHHLGVLRERYGVGATA